jgi:hypothetical protein
VASHLHAPPTHPGEMLLKEFLEPLGASQVAARGGWAFRSRGSMRSSRGGAA